MALPSLGALGLTVEIKWIDIGEWRGNYINSEISGRDGDVNVYSRSNQQLWVPSSFVYFQKNLLSKTLEIYQMPMIGQKGLTPKT